MGRRYIKRVLTLTVLSVLSIIPPLLRGGGRDQPSEPPLIKGGRGDLTPVSRAEYACRPHCLAASADYVYLAGEGRLLILDVSNPGSPRVTGYCETEFEAPQDLVLQGDLGYLSSPRGLAVFDLSDPKAPWQMGFCSLEGAADLVVNDNYAYLGGVTGGKWGLHVLDVSNPHDPKIVGQRLVANSIPQEYRLAHRGKYLYLGVRSDLWVLNVFDPLNPRETSHQSDKENLTALSFVDDYLGLAKTRGGRNIVSLYRVSSPSAFEEVGTLDLPESTPQRLITYGSYLLILGSNRDFYVVNMAPANRPRIVGCYHLPSGSDYSPAVSGHRVYVCDPDFGLWILDLSNPAIPVLEKSWNFPDRITGIHVSGKVGCLATKNLRVLDLSNPLLPRETGIFPLPGEGVVKVAFGMNVVYAAAGSMMTVLDVSDLSQPNVLFRLNLDAEICDIATAGKLAAVACQDGLRVLDLTIPFRPVAMGKLGSPDLPVCSGVALAEKIAYSIESGVGLKLVDLNKVKKLSVMASLALRDAKAVSVHGALIYVLGDSALYVVKAENKRKPAIAGKIELPERFESLSVWQNHLLLSSPEAGLRIYDLADPLNPQESGHLKPEWNLHGAAAQGNLIYTAEERWLGIYEMTTGR